MKAMPNIVKLQEFQLQNKQRQLAQLDCMMGEFGQMISELEMQIAAEEHKVSTCGLEHFAASTLACVARQRRDNLRHSVDNLMQKRASVKAEIVELESRCHQIMNRQQSFKGKEYKPQQEAVIH